VAKARRLPWAILVPSTAWGREVAGRLSIRLGAGLVGDAVGLDLHDGRLVCWKPALGGQLLAAVTVTSAVQLATVRPGALPQRGPREGGGVARVQMRRGRPPEDRVLITGRVIDDDPQRLARATVIIGVGSGVDPARYGELDPLLDILSAELAATRKVTDAGWLPRGRQVGLTGRMIAPRLYILLGASGKHNHMIATRGAGLIVAVNPDPAAPVFDAADIGITADWAEATRLLAAELATRRTKPLPSTRQLA
jgi:electron transfer flavoprotein alpha subunit